MLRAIVEGQVTWFSDLAIHDIPTSLPAGISIKARSGQIGLEAQGIVGSIPLLNGDTLHIQPKIGQVNFLRMLFVAEGARDDLRREYDAFVELAFESERSLDSLVSRQLVLAAGEILSRSPLTGRRANVQRSSFAAGRIDATRTAFNIASKASDPVVLSVAERTGDIPENRVITEALRRAQAFLRGSDSAAYLPTIYRWQRQFPSSNALHDDLSAVEARFAKTGYGGPRGYYRRALMLAQIILGSHGLGIGGSNSVEGDSLILNSADVYERYIRSTIASQYAPKGLIVDKGLVRRSLYRDGSYSIDPDVLILDRSGLVLIADAKYKAPTSADHYQMNCYLDALDLRSGMLISPGAPGAGVWVQEYMTPAGRVVREVFLPIDDFEATEAFLGSIVQKFS